MEPAGLGRVVGVSTERLHSGPRGPTEGYLQLVVELWIPRTDARENVDVGDETSRQPVRLP
jgi:hypothetical protein